MSSSKLGYLVLREVVRAIVVLHLHLVPVRRDIIPSSLSDVGLGMDHLDIIRLQPDLLGTGVLIGLHLVRFRGVVAALELLLACLGMRTHALSDLVLLDIVHLMRDLLSLLRMVLPNK